MVLLVVGAFGLYMVKYRVQTIKHEVAQAEAQLADERKNLRVLEAEWTFLNRPERLRTLSEKYLDVKPLRGQQIAEFKNIPYAGSVTVAKEEVTSAPTLVKFVNREPDDNADSYNDE
jgi:hypothetical protein